MARLSKLRRSQIAHRAILDKEAKRIKSPHDIHSRKANYHESVLRNQAIKGKVLTRPEKRALWKKA